MDNAAIAAALTEIGKLLEIKGENRYRVIAYEKAAKTVGGHAEPVSELVASGKVSTLRGVGDAMSAKISELVETGALEYLEALREEVPPSLLPLLELPGLGAKKVAALWRDHGVTSTDELAKAIEDGTLAGASGFGKRSLENLVAALARAEEHGKRVRLADAMPLADALVEGLRGCPQVIRVSEAGSVRRRCETVHDLDIVASTDDPAAVSQYFAALPQVERVVVQGSTKTTVELRKGLRADLRVVDDATFPSTLVHFTGSKAHNIRLRGRAKAAGMKISEYGVFHVDESGVETDQLPVADEAAFFAIFGLQEVPPTLREDMGEIEAAEKGELPERLIGWDDIQGTFHCHTAASDGTATLREMVDAARALGWSYLGITDHSRSSVVAGGLQIEELEAQIDEIRALDEELGDDFHLLAGTEVDILPDGQLDFPDELLARLDIVVASVHANLRQPRDEMTARVLAAVRHPHVHVLGHATGRQLLKREGSAVDLEAVIEAAAECGTVIELNATPRRLDMDWIHCRRAAELGVQIAITPDAHSPRALGYVRLGTEVGKKAWLTPEQVLNTRPWPEIREMLKG